MLKEVDWGVCSLPVPLQSCIVMKERVWIGEVTVPPMAMVAVFLEVRFEVMVHVVG